jgi:hypothetical protein
MSSRFKKNHINIYRSLLLWNSIKGKSLSRIYVWLLLYSIPVLNEVRDSLLKFKNSIPRSRKSIL